jgi:hypothetical protein
MKKLIFALFPFALLFGKTEIRLQTIDYEPFVEEMVAEIELEDGEIVSQTLNGKEATEEDFEKLAKETGEQIGFETEIVSFQQNAIAEYVGSFLESKGIEYENYGTKLVVNGKLDPEIVAEITQNFSFVESIEEIEYGNPINGADKPEFITHGYFKIPNFTKYSDFLNHSGSSLSSPFLASSLGSQLISKNYYLKYNPQLLKALLLSSKK